MEALALQSGTARFAGTVPRFVGRWRVEGLLGRGRRSKVYLARDRRERRVALKVAAGDLGAEFSLLAQVAHANVLRAIDCGVEGALHFLALEFAEGGAVAPARPLHDRHVLRVLTQAAAALAAVHAQGWVHRDVKPAHLLLRADGSLALADFGCARRIGETETAPPGTVIGSPLYAAPEQSRGAAAQPAADVYSLGACLHQLLTGAPLYPGQTLPELLGQHQLAPVPRLPQERSHWQPLLDAMLAKQPGERIADGSALGERLARFEHEAGLNREHE